MLHKTFRLIIVFLFLGLMAWGGFAGWHYLAARRAGTAISDTIDSDWPAGEAPAPGTRRRLLAAAQRIEAGDFADAVASLDPSTTISPAQKAAAERFFGQHAELQEQLVAAASDAQTIEQDGDDVTAVRTVLARALAAAARGDRSAVSLHLELAQAAVEAIVSGETGAAVAGPQAVAGLLQQMGPSFQFGRDLMTESHTAVEKLLRRARQHYGEEDFAQAAAFVRLAAQLSGVEPNATAADSPPDWFDSLQGTVPPTTAEATAVAAVQLCQSMAAADEPSPPVRTLIRNAKRELSAARATDAFWWATVALNALGMSDEQIAAATQQNDR